VETKEITCCPQLKQCNSYLFVKNENKKPAMPDFMKKARNILQQNIADYPAFFLFFHCTVVFLLLSLFHSLLNLF